MSQPISYLFSLLLSKLTSLLTSLLLSDDLISKIEQWTRNYLKTYDNKQNNWQHHLTTCLHLLGKILHIDETIQQIPTE